MVATHVVIAPGFYTAEQVRAPAVTRLKNGWLAVMGYNHDQSPIYTVVPHTYVLATVIETTTKPTEIVTYDVPFINQPSTPATFEIIEGTEDDALDATEDFDTFDLLGDDAPEFLAAA